MPARPRGEPWESVISAQPTSPSSVVALRKIQGRQPASQQSVSRLETFTRRQPTTEASSSRLERCAILMEMRPKERVSHDHWQPSWLRDEHLERYRFASQFVNDRTVVDCACGDGTGTRLLAQARAKRVHPFDASPEALAMARKTLPRTHAE